MPTVQTRIRRIPRTRHSMAGISLIELMVGITLGLLVLAGLAGVFANSSRSRSDIERASRQIENGRYALQVLTDDIRLAGFYGEFNPNTLATYRTYATGTEAVANIAARSRVEFADMSDVLRLAQCAA